MSTLYEDFMATGGAWEKGVVLKQIRSRDRNGNRACRKWLTKKQLLRHFEGDEELVEALIIRKETDADWSKSEVRPHPECPGYLFESICNCVAASNSNRIVVFVAIKF